MPLSKLKRYAELLRMPSLVVLLAASAIMPAACNTTAGIGEDLQAGGDALEDAAEDAND